MKEKHIMRENHITYSKGEREEYFNSHKRLEEEEKQQYLNQLREEGFLTLPEVLKIFPVCQATWHKKVKTGEYPQSYNPPGPYSVKVWKEEDIRKLIEVIALEKTQKAFQANLNNSYIYRKTKWVDKGKAEGKAELIKIMMLKNGLNCNKIAELTGLSTQQIEELVNLHTDTRIFIGTSILEKTTTEDQG